VTVREIVGQIVEWMLRYWWTVWVLSLVGIVVFGMWIDRKRRKKR